jgi:hypothetical protein
MRKRMFAITVYVTLALSAQLSYGETWTPLKRGVRLTDRPQINGRVLTTIPARARLRQLDRRGYWVKVEYQGKIGWVPLADVRLVTAEEKQQIFVVHTHTRSAGGIYSHIFDIRNTGKSSFSGTVTIIGYDSGETAFKESFSFAGKPIPARGARKATVNTNSDFSKLEYISSP